MKIFACTSYGPHTALTGGRLRRDNVLSALAARGHDVDRLDVPGRPGVRSATSAVREAVRASFRRRARDADVVLLGDVFCLPMMPVLSRVGTPVVVDLVDSPYRLVGAAPRRTPAERLSASAQSAQLVPVMQVLLPMTSGVTYISQEDHEVDRARVPRLPAATIVPNGVHASLFEEGWTPPPVSGYLAWLADWTYPPNRESFTWFVEEVSTRLPDDVLARLRTFGAGDPWAGRPSTGSWERARRAVVHEGFVDPLSSVYAGARGVVAPVVRGAGINNKVLEPLAAGRPVATTTVGVRGLPPSITAWIRWDATADGHAQTIRRLLDSPFTATEAEAGKAAVRALSWEAAGEAMERALRAACARS